MFKKMIVLLLCVLMISFSVQSSEAKRPPSYVKQQMILLGLYVYGINQELTKSVPDLGELQFLGESILGIAEQMKKTKRGTLFHKNLEVMLQTAKKLADVSKKREIHQAEVEAHNLINSCAQCHKMGSL